MRIYLTKEVSRRFRKAALDDDVVMSAVERAERGLLDADLGGGLIKQRVARPGEGRSGGYRTIIAYRRGARAVFLHMFEKSRSANINAVELEAYQRIARGYDQLSDVQLDALAARNDWKRIERRDDQTDLS